MLTETTESLRNMQEPAPCFVVDSDLENQQQAMGLKTQFKDCDIAYYLPTYPLIEDIAYRRFPELCERKNIAYKLNKSSAA